MTAVTEAPAAHVKALDQLLGAHGLRRHGQPRPVEGSVLNHNYCVETAAGRRFVRLHKANRTRERLLREHRAMAWAAGQGLPVHPPLAAEGGETLIALGGVLGAVYSWLAGRHLSRGAILPAQSAALGAMQGRLHRVLAGYHDPDLAPGGTGGSWDTGASIAMLSRVDDLIRYYPAHSEWTLEVQGGLRTQLGLLESGVARPSSDFARIATQPAHGDYHERNVLFDDGGKVAAVVDWEMVGLLPPVFEVLRAVSFSLLMEPSLLAAYLEGYRREASLPADDCEPGVEMWWQSLLHDTWRYRTRFIEGDLRAERFFAESLALLTRFSDPAYRASIAATLRQHAAG